MGISFKSGYYSVLLLCLKQYETFVFSIVCAMVMNCKFKCFMILLSSNFRLMFLQMTSDSS